MLTIYNFKYTRSGISLKLTCFSSSSLHVTLRGSEPGLLESNDEAQTSDVIKELKYKQCSVMPYSRRKVS
ncbi:hypothetical protein C0J52_21708 [Blattella germanica]|nr:hypothetical protein C0J52_21708 [Blattella germanica]